MNITYHRVDTFLHLKIKTEKFDKTFAVGFTLIKNVDGKMFFEQSLNSVQTAQGNNQITSDFLNNFSVVHFQIRIIFPFTIQKPTHVLYFHLYIIYIIFIYISSTEAKLLYFLQMILYGFYKYALHIYCFAARRSFTKNSRTLKTETWLFGNCMILFQ